MQYGRETSLASFRNGRLRYLVKASHPTDCSNTAAGPLTRQHGDGLRGSCWFVERNGDKKKYDALLLMFRQE